MAGLMNVDSLIIGDFNLVSGRKKRVEAHDQVGMTTKQSRHSADHAWRVDAKNKIHNQVRID